MAFESARVYGLQFTWPDGTEDVTPFRRVGWFTYLLESKLTAAIRTHNGLYGSAQLLIASTSPIAVGQPIEVVRQGLDHNWFLKVERRLSYGVPFEIIPTGFARQAITYVPL